VPPVPDNVQTDESKAPESPDALKMMTSPVGLLVPLVAVTVAVQVEGAPSVTGVSQATEVVVETGGFTVILTGPAELMLKAVEPPYPAEIWCEPSPTTLGEYWTEHEADPPEPDNEQVVELNTPESSTCLLKVTVPVGLVVPLAAETVAVQVEGP
jgi:hypothetical protein